MNSDEAKPITRRCFMAASAAVAGTAALRVSLQSQPPGPEKLALEGGPKAVASSTRQGLRWGAAERKQLEAMIGQESLFYWKGPQTNLFVERFRKFCPLAHVMPCSSGTAALHIASAAAGLAPGDEVITSPITDIGTVIGVIYQLGVPVFADVRPSTYNLDPADVERKITARTKAIIAVHLCGNPCDLASLRKIADARGLVLIEDCAQAWGAKHRGNLIGTTGDLACFSLQNSKLITCGDGGVVASGSGKFGPLLQRFGDKGYDRVQGGPLELFATNYRITEAQSAIAAAQLEKLESIVEARSRLGRLLSQRLGGLPGILPHEVHPEDRCSFWFYFFRIDPARLRCGRAEFVKALAAEGAPASAGYIALPLHRNPVFLKHSFFGGRWPVRELGLTSMDYTRVETPEAERVLATGVRIGLHEFMTEAEVEAIAAAVAKVARHYKS